MASMTKGKRRRVRGVFIGIDRYQSPDINELRFAERDVRALHALFADTLGDGAELLLGGEATRAALASQFAALAQADPDAWGAETRSGKDASAAEAAVASADRLLEVAFACVSAVRRRRPAAGADRPLRSE
jgi:ATP-dependent DNA helicase